MRQGWLKGLRPYLENAVAKSNHARSFGYSQVKAHGLTDAELERALQLLTKACDKQALHFLWRPQLQDVADEMVLETAINARVDMLVTFNQRHLHAAAKRFNLRCARPSECLHELEKLP